MATTENNNGWCTKVYYNQEAYAANKTEIVEHIDMTEVSSQGSDDYCGYDFWLSGIVCRKTEQE